MENKYYYSNLQERRPGRSRQLETNCPPTYNNAAILACCLACIDNSTISPRQKGFMPVEGCFEHSFLMNSLFEDSKAIKLAQTYTSCSTIL